MPIFRQLDTGDDQSNEQQLGLSGGGRAIKNCREKFGVLLNLMVRLASLQTSFLTVDEALKVTNRRVNALENVTIPRIEGILAYINKELDELEREDFTRLKKVQEKKAEKIAAEDAERKAHGVKKSSTNTDLMSGYDPSADPDHVL